MVIFGQIIVYIIMACAFIGCISLIFNEESELGKEFIAGIDSIGPIFLPVAGVMASVTLLTNIVGNVFGPLFEVIGADPAMAATTFIAVDMGGYQLADALSKTREGWIMAMMTGYMAGATIVFTIPVALKIIEKRDRKYLALGIMSGLLAIPVAVLAFSIIIALTNPYVREIISTNSVATYQLMLTWKEIFSNLVPIFIICLLLSLGLKFKPDKMINGFNYFGKILDAILKLVFVLVVIEYFTGIFSRILGNNWILMPIIATEDDIFRALEVAGAIGIMLCGAFPMVYLLRKYLTKPIGKLGDKFGLSSDATTALLAASANVLAALAMIKDLKAKDKVIVIAFSVCCAFLFGDHLSFTANFQPSLIFAIMFGKIVGGIFGIVFAIKLAVPKAEELELLEQNI
ncbi:ethanolamine utilization protein EutH [Fusobacterium sp.]|uniref:ethanolamine utilization protein EutH n=1 Tax=Fusobacterium sp. TaxID=68766 RepID=UPI00396C3D50